MFQDSPAHLPFLPTAHCVRVGPRVRVLVVALQSGKQADGGLESLTQLVTRYRETEIELLTQKTSSKTERWEKAGHRVRVWALPYAPGQRPAGGVTGAAKRIWHHLRWNLQVAWRVSRDNVDVIHVNDPHALWHSGFGAWLSGCPVLYNIRDTKPALNALEVKKWQFAFSLSACQVVLSGEMSAFWRGVVGSGLARRLFPIYSIVDPTGYCPLDPTQRQWLREELGLSGSYLYFGYIASFSPKKAQLRFIEEAGPLLRGLAGRWRILFIGDFDPDHDTYAAECQAAVRAQGLEDRLEFLGYQSAMHRWYQALDLVLVATKNEGLARCMIEALAVGTPVISFSVCSAAEIIEKSEMGGEAGRVINQGDYRGLVHSLMKVIEQSEPLGLWRTNAAAKAGRLFNPLRNTLAYETVYAKLAEHRP